MTKYNINEIVKHNYFINNKKKTKLVKISSINYVDNDIIYTYEYGFHFCSEGFSKEENLEKYNGPEIKELWLGL